LSGLELQEAALKEQPLARGIADGDMVDQFGTSDWTLNDVLLKPALGAA
jgi:hypothetical protein